MDKTTDTDRLAHCKTLLAELIAFPTVSSEGNRALTEYLAAHLHDIGAKVWTEPDATGDKLNLFATIGPDCDGGVILSGHTDVVPVTDQPWSSDPFEMSERDGRLFGRGTCDMKGFVAACVTMAPEFVRRKLKVPIHFAFTYDEEIGCFGAQALTASLLRRGIKPAAAIIGEPSSMKVIDGHKGCFEYTTWFTGLEGHGSAPDRGVNAIEYAARYMMKLVELREALKARAPENCPFDPPHTTINMGMLTGGVAHNVIPGKARLDWEMRPVQPADAAFVKAELEQLVQGELLPEMRKKHSAADICTDIVAEVAGLLPEHKNPARDLVMAVTGENDAGLVPFGTEAGLFQSISIPSVICGPGSIAQAHKPDEYLDVAQLSLCLKMLGRLGQRLETGPLM
ncbi:acetylornithine deacetylase [Roseinatronobacter bogoriensis]|uniref:Acetylornithine deacetylase n=1 Tax=Roseinatronobacter bogoriensis subsp. barguzinensis TaxID=441209 RepID=A0A2K8K8F1_9RHOB|nr:MULTISPECIES: acetylornithine deacetylase [Rhodobaca]ATX65216.1 acetylornithine deacetylase [Rhodobaca barguzinensis]MBB4209311.1 acetylornithine deacetylase [Rhodobaca bogoriensis DSM 18756]TDW34354.1 acetylornithine deacetylase [Rhodobaca barguzinensis]TDY67055.1 acetylornithine deacetylase [Rhodobaca bogoriensis DSM 18756]